MKVVLFCGGFGLRMREHAENIPKPLVNIGHRPILWNVMKYYAHFGHKDFILCLGWQGEAIKQYFLHYDECLSNDFVLTSGGEVNLLHSDIHDWRITFVDTGADANVGQRLLAVRPHLEGEEIFLANYADGLSDLPLPRLIRYFHEQQATAAFVAVRPQQSWHAVDVGGHGAVQDIQPISDCGTWMNGGYFVFHERIFNFIEESEELVLEPFRRLIARQELFALKYDGFWSCMDTYKDKQRLDDLVARGDTPWEVWKEGLSVREEELGKDLSLKDGSPTENGPTPLALLPHSLPRT
jgi:glucose-1-phosphate cytidylyltransferase